jgi:hypothetical protein
MKLESSEARKTTERAISAGSAIRPRGYSAVIRPRACCGTGVLARYCSSSDVSMSAGQIALQRIPSRP